MIFCCNQDLPAFVNATLKELLKLIKKFSKIISNIKEAPFHCPQCL